MLPNMNLKHSQNADDCGDDDDAADDDHGDDDGDDDNDNDCDFYSAHSEPKECLCLKNVCIQTLTVHPNASCSTLRC